MVRKKSFRKKIYENHRDDFCNFFKRSLAKWTNVWNKVLASKENWSLGVSSYHALNCALLLKWVWRFISQDGSLWFRVIKALYETSIDSHPVNLSSNWCSIIRELHLLVGKCFHFLDHCKKRTGNGGDTCFWYDNWLGDKPLKDLFPRLFAFELNKEVTVADKVQGVVSSSFRRPVRVGSEYQHLTDLNLLCDLSGDGEFRVKEVRNFLDNLFLHSYADATRWVKYIPIKINVFVWRARRDFLHTRVNLSRREHLSSDMSMVGVRLASFGVFFELELLVFFDSSLVQSQALLEGVFCVAWWSIWGFRNRTVYNEMPQRRSVLFDDIVSLSFNWFSSRCHASLRRVLVGYSFRDSDVGYCQGLKYVAALLLLMMKTEEDAFWLLAVLLENVLVTDCYSSNLTGCNVEQRVFKDLLKKKCSSINAHLESLEFEVSLVATELLESLGFSLLWRKVLFNVALAIFK
nr:RNA-directed DNA polymerase, eukaryota [Tanacetum cinerariifolium]